MSNANALLEDLLTFLCFLHANDVAPRGYRWLPPSALVWLKARLLAPDTVTPTADNTSGGKRGTTERETDRIRFVHFLCEAAGLVAVTGRLLKPTPRVARWLNLSDGQRVSELFAAAFPTDPDRAHDDLWRAYRLPGWRLSSPSTDLAPLVHILREAPHDERIRVTTLLKLVPLPALADDPDAQPETVLRGLLRYLEWLDIVERQGRSAIRITDRGYALLTRTDQAASIRPMPPAARVAVEINEIEVSGDWPTLYELSEYAELLAVRPRRRYRLDRDLVRRALDRGTSLDHILRFLESAAGSPLPRAIPETLQRWAGDFDRIHLHRATLLETRDPQLLAELLETRLARQSVLRTLSPRAVIIREHRVRPLVSHLRRRGYSPRLGLSPSVDTSTHDRLLDVRTARLFDTPTLAHLYLSACVCHRLSDLIPPAWRAPYSVLLDLERHLTPRDRDVIAGLADECAARILETRAPKPQREDDVIPAPATGAASLVEQAIQAGKPLELVYTDAYGVTTTRVVEPHRLEPRRRVTYLIAYCRLDQAERTFRLDRIQSISEQ